MVKLWGRKWLQSRVAVCVAYHEALVGNVEPAVLDPWPETEWYQGVMIERRPSNSTVDKGAQHCYAYIRIDEIQKLKLK